jgi:hypothetical protein
MAGPRKTQPHDPALSSEPSGQGEPDGRVPGTGSVSPASSTEARRGPGRPRRGPDLSRIRHDLAEDLTRLGTYMSFGLPLTGMVIVNRAQRAANCLADLAEQNPAVARLLAAVTGISVYAELAFVVGDVVVAAGVERGAIPVDHPLATNIRPEIEIVVRENQAMQERMAAAAAAAEREAAGQGVPPAAE